MQIKINIQIFAIIAILVLTKQIKIYVWLMIFALIHELAHICVGIILKLKPKSLEIQPFGIGVVFENFKNTERNKIIIATAGPAINIIIAIIFRYISCPNQEIIVNTNTLLAVFNLIPMYPLDGGRILKALIKMKSEEQKAEDITNKISNIFIIIITFFTSILILIYKNLGLFIVVIYLWVITIRENNRYILKKRIEKIIEKNR